MGGGAALNLQLQIRACRRGTHGTVELVALGHGVTVGFEHHITGAQTSFGCRAVRFHRGDFNATGDELGRARTGVRRAVLHARTQVAVGCLTLSDDLGGDALGVVGGNGERHTIGGATVLACLALRVDADQFTLEVHQRAAGVTVVDGSVNLNHGDVVLALRVGRLHAVCVRDHAGGYRFATTIRRAEGNHYLAGDQLGGVTPGDGLQVQAGGVNLQDRQVSGRVQAHYGCGAYGAVAQAHLNGGCGAGRFEGNHVVVGEDVAFLVEDNATTAAGGGAVRSNDSHGGGQDLLRGFCYACHGGGVADIGAHGAARGSAGGAVV